MGMIQNLVAMVSALTGESPIYALMFNSTIQINDKRGLLDDIKGPHAQVAKGENAERSQRSHSVTTFNSGVELRNQHMRQERAVSNTCRQ
jgi:hypothetical protein